MEDRPAEQLPNQLPTKVKGSRNKNLILIGMGLLIVLMGGYIYYLTNKNVAPSNASSTDKIVSTPSTSPTPAPLANGLLPLGDGHVTTSPKKGSVYACQTTFTGGGAAHDGDWISGTTWDPAKKLQVAGDVAWPTAKTTLTTSATKRTIVSNDLPTIHHTGIFPIAKTDPAYQIDTNPNSIKAQSYTYSLPASPLAAASPGCVSGGPIGIMLDGVLLFDALDAAGRDAVAHEVQDKCDGHPERSGSYHYHGLSSCLPDGTTAKLIGYGFDGYGIYGNKDATGKTLTTADLDECHGITSSVTWEGKTVSMYHYVMTADYPYSIGCYHGTSAVSAGPPPR